MRPQHTLDPDIDRECTESFVRKKHYAICNLRPNAGQRAELCSKLDVRKRRPRLEIRFAGADESRRRVQIFGAIAKFAIAQLLLGSVCKSLRRRKRVNAV